MPSPFNPYSILFFLILSINPAASYFFTGYSVRDLERNDALFINDVSSWTMSRASPPLYTTCSSTYLLGGAGVLGPSNTQMNDKMERMYTGLPTHTMVYFSFTLWAIDAWQINDYIIIQFDTSTTFNGWKTFDSSNFPSPLCGTTGVNDISDVRIFGASSHTASSITFTVSSRISTPSATASFGIRNVNLMFVSSPTASTTMCAKASISIGGTKECACPEGQYESSPGVCTNCDASCASCFASGNNGCYDCKSGYSFGGTQCFPCSSLCTDCFGTGSSQCLACKSGNLLFNNNTCVASTDCTSPLFQTGGGVYCESPCTNSSHYVYWNSTCISSCNSPLQTSSMLSSLVKLCVYPCSNSQYLYWDGTCASTCPSPLTNRTEGGKNFCDFGCSAGQFLYWDGSCSGSCLSPLSNSTLYSRDFCGYPCANTEYLYWNGTCASACDSPLTTSTTKTKNLCNFICTGTDYLYWNGTCDSNCLFPLLQVTEGGKNFCRYPCADSEYLYWDGTCVSTCSTPLTSRIEGGKNFCDHPCLSTEYILMNGSCLTSCDFPLIQSGSHQIIYCLLPCTDPLDYYHPDTSLCNSVCLTNYTYERGLYLNCPPITETSALVFPITKLLHHLRYINTNLPLELQITSLSRGNNLISMRVVPEMFSFLNKNFPNLRLPSEFVKPNLSSSFLANFIDDLILLGILIFFEVLFLALQMLPLPYNFKIVIKKLRILTGITLPLMLIATNIGDIIFFCSLEFRTFDPDYTGANLSLTFSIILLVISAVCVVLAFCLVLGVRKAKAQGMKSKAYVTFANRWHNFQVLYGGIGEVSDLIDPSFFLIYCIRQAFPMIFTSWLFDYPLAQIIIYTTTGVVMILYLLFKKPIKKLVDYVNLMVIEGVILLVDISTLLLIIFDMQDVQSEQAQDILGKFIIVGNYVIVLQAVFFLIVKAALIIKQVFRLRKEGKNRQQDSLLLQMIFLPFQQGAFCFEQVNMNELSFPAVQKVIPLTGIGQYMKEVRTMVENGTPLGIGKDSYIQLNKDSNSPTIPSNNALFSPQYSSKDQDYSGQPEIDPVTKQNKANEILSFIASTKPINPTSPSDNLFSANIQEEIDPTDPEFYIKRKKMIQESMVNRRSPSSIEKL